MKCQFALQLKKTNWGGRGWFYLESLWHLWMHLHKQHTGSLMTTLPGAVAFGLLSEVFGEAIQPCLPSYCKQVHLSSPVRTQMKCHSSDLAMFLIVSCVTWSVSLCLTACPAKSYFQCWSGWSTLSHFQERGCECTSKKKNGWILNWSTLYFKLVHLIINKLYFFQDNEKRTPLHAAAYLGDAEIIELLILSGKCIWNIHHNEYKYEAPRISSLWFQVSSNVYLMYCFTVIHVLLVM